MAIPNEKNTNRPVRVEDVARVAGVSPITVSRALSYPEKVKEQTRQRVAEAVAQTGYIVNSLASSLRSGRSSIVTVFVSSLLNAHYAVSMQGIVDAFEGSRFHLMFAQIGYSEMVEMDVVSSALPFRPAGVVFTGVVRSEATRSTLRALGIPIVEMWGVHPDPIDMLVSFSNFDGGRLMGRHFGERGFRRIAYCGHVRERGADRVAGFQQGLAEFGASVALSHPLEDARLITDGMAALDQILERLPDCDAVFFGSDVLASGAILRAYTLGIDVPGQLAIAGFGGLDFAPHVRPALTTVHMSSYEMGFDAGTLLRRRLNSEAISEKLIEHPITLAVRESTSR